MSNVVTDDIFNTDPGLGMNANNFEGETYIDLTGPMGSMTGLYYSAMFQLRKLGFETIKIEETIDVSPVFKQYYDLTIQQRQALEAQVKAGLGQIATAIHDYELIGHDQRKYKEYMDYFTKIEQGKEMEKKAKMKDDKEKAEAMVKEGMQTLRSVFIDQVDAFTGEQIALKTITQRWPTIIVDFMRLDDKDVDQKKIAERYQFSEAEASVLATKNKLFMEWRDSLFKPTLLQRYQNVLRLVEARKTSIAQYTEMLKPTIARFKILNDALQTQGGRAFEWRLFFQPAAQAFSRDTTRIWAFLPFGPSEKYKVTRDYLDEIPARKAGFTKNEIEFIQTQLKGRQDLNAFERTFLNDGNVTALPAEPSIDDVVRRYAPRVEQFYGVKITPIELFNARQRLVNLFFRKAMETQGGRVARRLGPPEGLAAGNTWVFSPYFVFLDVPFVRMVLRLPNGNELENLMVDNLTIQGRTQNVIVVCLLETIAHEKQLEDYIKQLVGEVGGPDMIPIAELAKEQYPELLGKPSQKLMTGMDIQKAVKQFKWFFADFMEMIGRKWGVHFDWLRARGPYEFAMDDRIAEVFQLETMMQGFLYLLRYLQRGAGVPGVRV